MPLCVDKSVYCSLWWSCLKAYIHFSFILKFVFINLKEEKGTEWWEFFHLPAHCSRVCKRQGWCCESQKLGTPFGSPAYIARTHMLGLPPAASRARFGELGIRFQGRNGRVNGGVWCMSQQVQILVWMAPSLIIRSSQDTHHHYQSS